MAKALIVSGDEAERYLYKMAIEFQKIEVLLAKDIKEAIKKILVSVPDLVILDLKTIDFDKIAELKVIKKSHRSLPVIIMTELKKDEAKKQACVLGACQILAQKEATLGNLIKKTRETVRK